MKIFSKYYGPCVAFLFISLFSCTKVDRKTKPKFILDLACGTGLFIVEFLKAYPDCICDGSDISEKILVDEVENSNTKKQGITSQKKSLYFFILIFPVTIVFLIYFVIAEYAEITIT